MPVRPQPDRHRRRLFWLHRQPRTPNGRALLPDKSASRSHAADLVAAGNGAGARSLQCPAQGPRRGGGARDAHARRQRMRHAGAHEAHQRRQEPAGGAVAAADRDLRHGGNAGPLAGARRAAAGAQASGRARRAHRDHELLFLPQRLRPRPRAGQRARQGQRGGYRLVRHRPRPGGPGGRGLGPHRAPDRGAGGGRPGRADESPVAAAAGRTQTPSQPGPAQAGPAQPSIVPAQGGLAQPGRSVAPTRPAAAAATTIVPLDLRPGMAIGIPGITLDVPARPTARSPHSA